jgi:hypothetical protein
MDGGGVHGFSHRVRRHFTLNLKATAVVLIAPVEFFYLLLNFFYKFIVSLYCVSMIWLASQTN